MAGFLKRFKDSPVVKAAFGGLRPASTALIAAVLISLFVSNFLDTDAFSAQSVDVLAVLRWKKILLGAAVFTGTKIWKKAHPAFFLLFGAVMGIVLQL